MVLEENQSKNASRKLPRAVNVFDLFVLKEYELLTEAHA
jgi:hypothetical protein